MPSKFGGIPVDQAPQLAVAPQPAPAAAPDYGYGNRSDGTPKGKGYFGELKRPDGDFSTEISIGVDYGNGEKEIPSLVPGLSEEEKTYLLSGGKPTKSIINKAIDHAKMREAKGLSPFAGPDDLPGAQPSTSTAIPAKVSKFGGVPVDAAPVGKGPDPDVPQIGSDGQPIINSQTTLEPAYNPVGTGEAALSLATGATTGAAGMIGGTVKGILDELKAGKFGTQEAADRIEKAASDAGSALTYAPRTDSGKEQVQAAGEAMAPLAALGPMVGEGAALAQGAKNIAPIMRAAVPEASIAAKAEPLAASAAADAAPAAAAAVQDAAPAAQAATAPWTWKSGDTEHPVDILPQTYTSPDGKNYQRVLYQGKETFVAADDLTPPPTIVAGEPVAPVNPPTPEAAAAKPAPAAALDDSAQLAAPTPAPAVAAVPEAQQSVEGLAKTITDSTQAKPKNKIPTMERLADEVRPDETILQAADRLGIRDQLIPSQYSKSQAYREIEQGIASIPGSQLNVQQKAAATLLAQKADDLIQKYGGNIDKAALSTDFKNRGMAMVDDLEKQSNELYDQVSKAIPPTTKITADSTLGYLTNKAKEVGGADALSPLEKRTLTMLSGGTKAVPADPNSAAGLASFGQAKDYQRILPTYARVDQLRKQVGEGLRGRGAFKDAESGSLKQLYSKLSDDQQASANSLGAGELFSAAKQIVARRKAIEDDLMGVLGKDLSGALTVKTGNAIKSLSSGNYKDFDMLMSKIPKDMQQRVVMTSLNDALTNGSRMEKQLSAPGFVDWYEGLKRNNTARRRLYQYMPREARRTLDDIAKVAKGMRDASKERITTGRIQALMDNFATEGGMLSKLYGVGKDVALAEGAGHAVGLPGVGAASVIVRAMSKTKTPIMKAADDLLASPQFKTALNEHARAKGKGAAQAEARLEKTKVYQKWFKALSKAQQAAVKADGAMTWLSLSASQAKDMPDDKSKTDTRK